MNSDNSQDNSLSELQGVLERITFHNEENGFTVARLQVRGKAKELVTLVGHLSGVPVGSDLCVSGWWIKDAKHGIQFKVKTFAVLKPNTLRGIERYLGSGLIKGIGPGFAGRIVKHFGLATLDILEQHPEKLTEVPGLGGKRLEQIQAAWADQKAIHRIMVFLQGHGISAAYAVKIYKTYDLQAFTIVQTNPYRLSEDIWGIGFKTADKIAQAVGVPEHDPRRARAGLLYALNEAADDGHCYLPFAELLALGENLLGQSGALLEREIPGLVQSEKLVVDGDRVYLAPLFFAERGVAGQIGRMANDQPGFGVRDIDSLISQACREMRIKLAPEQEMAIRMAAERKVGVLTGGPGTGKSTILKILARILEKNGLAVRLAAPTGRAAKRLGDACGREARTIHRLLEFDRSIFGFKRNAENPLAGDFFIIDEVSMLDTVLANALFRAIPRHASLLLVGDPSQLPSVGSGNVLRDLIDSERIAVVSLSKIFRQGQGSLITVNAMHINRGESLELQGDFKGEKDFYFIHRQTPEDIEQEIVSLLSGRLRKRYGFDPVKDIQIVTPMRKGLIGSVNLNLRLQELLNTKGVVRRSASGASAAGEQAVLTGFSRFLPGDKVMQIRNNYDKDVFNGDQGIVIDHNREAQKLAVDFEGRRVEYDLADMSELELAYAITVHKSQGSEFPCVIFPLHTTHFPLLQRNLVYTGITRGKRLVILVGSAKAYAMAVRNNKVVARYTGLKERLQSWHRD